MTNQVKAIIEADCIIAGLIGNYLQHPRRVKILFAGLVCNICF